MAKIADEIGDGQKQRADEAQKAAEKLGEETDAASKKMQAADAALIQQQVDKMTLKDQAAFQAGKVADAEQRVAKATEGSVEWYERLAELAKERLALESKIDDRAKAYAKSSQAGRKFDREQIKEKKQDAKARARLDRQMVKEGVNQPAIPGVPAVAPRPAMQPQAPPPAQINQGQGIAGQAMRVDTLIVGTLKSK